MFESRIGIFCVKDGDTALPNEVVVLLLVDGKEVQMLRRKLSINIYRLSH
jgi:hypothetical protein